MAASHPRVHLVPLRSLLISMRDAHRRSLPIDLTGESDADRQAPVESAGDHLLRMTNSRFVNDANSPTRLLRRG